MPREYFNKTLLLNKKLKQEKEKLSMQVFRFRQEKMDLAHKLREREMNCLVNMVLPWVEESERSLKPTKLKGILLQLLKNKKELLKKLKKLKKRSSKSIENMNHSKSLKL